MQAGHVCDGQRLCSAVHKLVTQKEIQAAVLAAGGASLSGGAVLLKYFTAQQLLELSPRLQPQTPTGLQYYPLLRPGERFPGFDGGKQPVLEPRPADDAVFLQAMLEGMASIEAEGYR